MMEKQPISDPGFRAPQQERSRQTLDRILAAARDILGRKSAEETTVAELASAAGVTVGAIYARFSDKATLLRLLQEEALKELALAQTTMLKAAEAEDVSIDELLERLIRELAAIYRTHRGAMRSMLLESWSDPARQKRRMDFTAVAVGRTIDWLLERRGRVRHPQPKTGMAVALLLASSALRQVILFDEKWLPPGVSGASEERLVEEIIDALRAFLRIDAA